jgi:hypothetical protein
MDPTRRRFLQKLLALAGSVAATDSLLALTGCSTETLTGPRSPASADQTKSLDDSICIVGAGASGIAAAHFLQKKGYTNVTILEASDHIGGKCNTIHIGNKAYDMGAVFTTSSYDEVRALSLEFNAPIIPLQGHTKKNIVNSDTGIARMRGNLETVDLGLAALEYFRALQKYPHLIRSGFANLHPDLCLPLSTWMKNFSLMPASLNEFFGFTFTPFGYGFVDEVPAAYALKYYEPRLVTSLISGDNLGMVRDGYQSLWQKVAENLNVQLSTPVLKITRSPTGPALVETEKSSRFYDHLILTTMPEDTLKFLDATPEEQNDFSKVKRYFYYSIAVEVPDGFGSAGFLPDNYVESRAKHPLCWFKRWTDGNIAIFYALSSEDIPTNEIVKTLIADATHYQWNLGTVHAVKKWRYFPHYRSEDLADGIYDRIENRQGMMRTYVAGELMNFSTVEMVSRYAKDLILRFF